MKKLVIILCIAVSLFACVKKQIERKKLIQLWCIENPHDCVPENTTASELAIQNRSWSTQSEIDQFLKDFCEQYPETCFEYEFVQAPEPAASDFAPRDQPGRSNTRSAPSAPEPPQPEPPQPEPPQPERPDPPDGKPGCRG